LETYYISQYSLDSAVDTRKAHTQFALTLTYDLDFRSPVSKSPDPERQKFTVKVQLVQKTEWKQTAGRTRPIALPFPLTRSAVKRQKASV